MEVQPGDLAEDVKRLQRCMNDLVSLFALPAMWSAGEPSQIANTLIDALLRVLQLDLVYIQLKDPGGQAPITLSAPVQKSHEIGEAFKPWLEADLRQWPARISIPIGDGDISIVPLGLGMQGELGVMVAGSGRANFPLQTEKLILSVAANQASIGLQGARLLSEQKRVANEELRKEIADREQAVRSRKEFHRVIVETASDTVVSIDHKGDVIFANHAVKRTFGYDPSELIGQSLTMLMPEYLRDLHSGGFHRYQKTAHRNINWQGIELIGLRKTGEEFPVEVSFGELVDDGHPVFTGFIRDISERKQAEETLRASERNLSLIIETIPGLVWCAAVDGELTYLNQRLLDYTGTSADDWAQLGWKNLLHPEDAEPTAQAWSGAVATGQPFEAQCRIRRFDGVYRWFQALGQAARDSAGKVNRWYGLLIDIDERNHMEEALRNSQARLSRAIRTATIGEFAAAIAHEINQPLAAVVANGQACLRWLAAQPPGTARAKEAAERIVRDGKEAGEVVRRIRSLFKQSTLEKVELDLNDVIGEVLHMLNTEIVRRRVAVETDLYQNLAPIAGDRVQLQQLIFNLLLNGLDSMDAAMDRPKKLFISSKQSSLQTILFEVRDSGTGVKDPDRIFDAFFTTKENGMGMGLAICRSIVEAHHGRLWVESGEGTGAIFFFTLPAAGVA